MTGGRLSIAHDVENVGIVRPPYVDLERLAGRCERSRTRAAIAQACETLGFFAVSRTNVADETISAARRAASDFFALSADLKLAALAGANGAGYVPPPRVRSPEFVCAAKEAFNVIPGKMDDLWPSQPTGFRSSIECYVEAMRSLCQLLLGLMSEALGYARDQFEPRFGKPASMLRLVSYAPYDNAIRDQQLRCEQHSDLGALTILDSTFDRSALQVRSAQGRWMALIPSAETLLVNVGDELLRWSAGRWISPLHRVGLAAPRDRSPRLSLIWFHNPESVTHVVERYINTSSRTARSER